MQETRGLTVPFMVAIAALAVVLATLALPWTILTRPDAATLSLTGIDLARGVSEGGKVLLQPLMTLNLALVAIFATGVMGFVWRSKGGSSLLVAGSVVGAALVLMAMLYTFFAPPKALREAGAVFAPGLGFWLAMAAFVGAFFASRAAAPADWRNDLPESVRPYFETGPLAALALGLSSGFPFAMIGATLTTRLAQDGIDKSTITAFTLAILMYNLKWAWAWIVDGVRIPVLGALGQRVSWLLVSGVLVIAAVINLASVNPDPNNIFPTVIAAVLVAAAGATFDIVIDGYRIETLKPEQLGPGSGMSQYGWRIGSAAAGGLALFVAARFGWNWGYAACAIFALPAMIAGLIVGEPERHRAPAQRKGLITVLKSIWGPFAQFFMREGAVIVLIFILVHKIGDTLGQLTVRLLFNDLGFSNDEIAFFDVSLGFFAYMIGIFAGGILYERLGMKKSVLISLILMAVSNASFALLAGHGHSTVGMGLAMGFENFASGIGGVVVVAYFSALTDLRYTAAQYALISAAASVIGRLITGTTAGDMIKNFGFANFYWFTTLIALPGVLIFWWMIRTGLVDRSIGTAGTVEAGPEKPAD